MGRVLGNNVGWFNNGRNYISDIGMTKTKTIKYAYDLVNNHRPSPDGSEVLAEGIGIKIVYIPDLSNIEFNG